MEYNCFATMSDNLIFNEEDVKIRRSVAAFYKQKGMPEDWKETDEKN